MKFKTLKKQRLVIKLLQQGRVNEILYGGAAGGGKSVLLRMIAIIWCINVPGVQVYLFRRKVKDLIATHLRGPMSFKVMLKDYIADELCKINNSDNTIEFTNGSVISLNHCQHESDIENFLSTEMHVLLLDEATTFTEKMIRELRGRLRLGSFREQIPEEFRNCLPFIIYGTNPKGISHNYFSRGFVNAKEPHTIFKAPTDDGGMKRIFIPSLISDNPYIDEDYAERLMGMGDPDVVAAYLAGDWSIVEGAALPSLSRKHHVIPGTYFCKSWPIYRAYDYGYSAPYFVAFYMVATGESDNPKFNPPKGSIIIHTIIYGADKNEGGLKEDVQITGRKIKNHESLYYPWRKVLPGPADNSIFDSEQGPSIADSIGVKFEKSDKTAGSRILGLAEIRRLLFNSIFHRNEEPGLYFSSLALELFNQLRVLPVDDKNIEDVDTSANDHGYDVVRYIALHRNKSVSLLPVNGA